MRSEWEIVKLGNVTSKIGSGSTPRGGSKVYLKDGECALFRSQNVLNNSFSKNGLVYIDSEAAKKLQNVNIERSDVLLNITGDSVARVCKAPCEYLPARVNQHVAIIRTIPSKLNSSYLNYYLNSRSMQNYMLTIASAGATRNALTKGMIEDFDISAPPLQTQKKIAHILSTLDDKIELNRKMNQTLEEMAQALFKSWFVDFDPVHAKNNAASDANYEQIAKELGVSHDILDSFPDEFEESEFGMIPTGWEVANIASKLDVMLGGTPSRRNDSYWTNGTVAWINSGKVNEFRITEASELITEEAMNSSSTKLLPKKTTVLAITGATLGQVSLLEIDSCANQSVIGLPETNELNHSFIYPCISHAIQELISHQTGGAQQHINKGNVEDYSIIIPNEIVLKNYVSIAKPLMNTISNNSFEIQTLQQTRDKLLPRLLSGELDVSELELDNVTH
jgi:type I restriction enzyme S subunit